MRLPRIVLLSCVTLAPACSGGGGSPPPSPPAVAGSVDLNGTWRLHSSTLESSGVAIDIGLEAALAEVTFLANEDADIYSVVLPGVDPRPLGAMPSSIWWLNGEREPSFLVFVGLYYLAAQDATIALSQSIDSEQVAQATLAQDRFVTLLDFEVFDGDAMVVVFDGEFPVWDVDPNAVRLATGRIRTVGERQ